MVAYKAGQEIDAFCTKCKMDLLHRIVAEVRGAPQQVECRTCKTTHKYRAVKGVGSPGAEPIARLAPPPAPRSSSSSSASPSAPRRRVAEAAPLMPPDKAHIHLYAIATKFAADTWIQHKTFGIGMVVREVGPGKIEVRFDDTSRVLIHDYRA